jgi:hypothetical protein
MENHRKPSSIAGLMALTLLALLLLPVVYMLASGPVAWLTAHGYVSEAQGTTLYYLPDELSRNNRWFNECWQVYLRFWRSP